MSRRLHPTAMLTTWTWFQRLATRVRGRAGTELRRQFILRRPSAGAGGGGGWGDGAVRSCTLHSMFYWTPRCPSHFFRRRAGELAAAQTSDSCARNRRPRKGAHQRSLPCRCCALPASRVVNKSRGGRARPTLQSSFLLLRFVEPNAARLGSAPCNPRQGPLPQAPSAGACSRRPNIRGSGLPRPCSLRVHDA
jgi:hypothetical protein